MKRAIVAILLCAAGTVLLVAATVSRRAPDDQSLIKQARLQQNDAIARRDFTTAATFWTPDVSVRAGLGRNLQGRDAYFAAFTGDSTMIYVREPTEIIVSTNWPLAFERGRWTGRLRASRNQPLFGGHYSAQWVKSGSRWLIRSEVFVATECASVACKWPAIMP